MVSLSAVRRAQLPLSPRRVTSRTTDSRALDGQPDGSLSPVAWNHLSSTEVSTKTAVNGGCRARSGPARRSRSSPSGRTAARNGRLPPPAVGIPTVELSAGRGSQQRAATHGPTPRFFIDPGQQLVRERHHHLGPTSRIAASIAKLEPNVLDQTCSLCQLTNSGTAQESRSAGCRRVAFNRGRPAPLRATAGRLGTRRWRRLDGRPQGRIEANPARPVRKMHRRCGLWCRSNEGRRARRGRAGSRSLRWGGRACGARCGRELRPSCG